MGANMHGCWSYDVYGNRLSESMSTTACSSSPPKLSWATFNWSNNQMVTSSYAPGRVGYDASGNTLSGPAAIDR